MLAVGVCVVVRVCLSMCVICVLEPCRDTCATILHAVQYLISEHVCYVIWPTHTHTPTQHKRNQQHDGARSRAFSTPLLAATVTHSSTHKTTWTPSVYSRYAFVYNAQACVSVCAIVGACLVGNYLFIRALRLRFVIILVGVRRWACQPRYSRARSPDT